MPLARRSLIRRTLLAAGVVVSLVIGGAVPAIAAEPTTGSITGVLRTVGGELVRSGSVILESLPPVFRGGSALIRDGQFAFPTLPPGDYRLKAELTEPADGGGEWWPGAPDRARALTVHVDAGRSTDASWQLSAVPADIVGTVIDTVTLQPVANYTLNLNDPAGASFAHRSTDAAGRFRFARVPSGDYLLEAPRSQDGRYAAHTGADGWPLSVPETGTAAADVALTPRGRIAFALSGISHAPIINAYPTDSNDGTPFYTGIDHAESPYLEPGEYQVFLQPYDSDGVAEWWMDAPTRAQSATITVVAGQDTSNTWAVRRGGIVSGRVTDADTGAPVVDVYVDVRGMWAMTDEDGRYLIDDLPAGDHPLTVSGGEYTTAVSSVHVELGESVGVDVSVHHKGVIEATTTSVESGRVELYDAHLRFVRAVEWRGMAGVARFDSIDGGIYYVRFLAEGRLPTWLGGTTTAAGSTTVVVRPHETTSATQQPIPATPANSGTLRIAVSGPDGEQVDAMAVEVYDAEGLLRETLSTVEGYVTTRALPTGAYRVHVKDITPRGFTGFFLTWRYPYDEQWLGGTSLATAIGLPVQSGTSRSIAVGLTRTLPAESATLTGRVTTGTAPVAGARVSLFQLHHYTGAHGSPEDAVIGYTDASGRYALRGVPPGEYQIAVDDAPHWEYPLATEYVGGGTAETSPVVVLPSGATVTADHSWAGRRADGAQIVRGRVTAADTGEALAGVTVRVNDFPQTADADGYYEWPTNSASNTIQVAAPPGYAGSAAFTATVATGSAVTSNIALLRNLTTTAPGVPSSMRVGVAVKATVTGWTTGATLTYQWRRSGVAIPDATGPTYTPTSSDYGKQLSVTVTGRKSGYTTVSKTSVSRGVSAGTLTSSTPRIVGTTKVGRTLSVSRGTWSSSVTFTYQWYRNGVAVAGATRSTYVLTWRDAGAWLKVKVTGRKAGYATVARVSSATARVHW